MLGNLLSSGSGARKGKKKGGRAAKAQPMVMEAAAIVQPKKVSFIPKPGRWSAFEDSDDDEPPSLQDESARRLLAADSRPRG